MGQIVELYAKFLPLGTRNRALLKWSKSYPHPVDNSPAIAGTPLEVFIPYLVPHTK